MCVQTHKGSAVFGRALSPQFTSPPAGRVHAAVPCPCGAGCHLFPSSPESTCLHAIAILVSAEGCPVRVSLGLCPRPRHSEELPACSPAFVPASSVNGLWGPLSRFKSGCSSSYCRIVSVLSLSWAQVLCWTCDLQLLPLSCLYFI